MHGRIKVRTTEEEKLRKEKERAEKLKVFKHYNETIWEKWKKKEYDEEFMKLTEKVLAFNPDINTLWNMRKMAILALRVSLGNPEDVSSMHNSELVLTENCLKINPKSYCTWYQRQWVLTTRPDPDWKKEMDLCNTYLTLDERNFHTWDYRRFVVKQFNPPLEEEFAFTTNKINENFSNYSAWHHRSKLLLLLHPDSQSGRPIQDAQHKQELKLVQSAAFTDPDDTSAWFYQRWLLGAVKVITQLVVCTVTEQHATFAFNKCVSENFVSVHVKLFLNDDLVKGKWESCMKNHQDNLWIFKHNKLITISLQPKVEYENETGIKQTIICKEIHPQLYIGQTQISFQRSYSQPVMEELKNQLESCQQLLALEPDNRWTLLTATFFLYNIDANVNHKAIIQNLSSLMNIDKIRKGYYEDLISQWNIEHQLCQDYVSVNLEMQIKFEEKITSLPHMQYYHFCRFVDLSNQNITSKVLPSMARLLHCKILNLENNKITTLDSLPLINLDELKLKGNMNLDVTSVIRFQKKLTYSIDF